MKGKKYIVLLVALIVFFGCNYEFPEEPTPKPEDLGNINLEKVIAIGDGFVAGVMDGSLYTSGQENSLAAIINKQFAVLTEHNYIQPKIDSENGYNLFMQTGPEVKGKWIYRFLNNTDKSPARLLSNGETIGTFSGDKNALQDLSMPGLKVSELYDPDLQNDPFFKRTFSDDGSSMIDQIISKSPSFTICWIGINDYLEYALRGGTVPDLLTSVENFEDNYFRFIEELLNNTTTRIILINLISFRDFPYFFLRQYNFVTLNNIEKALAQATYNDFNDAVAMYNVGKPFNEWRPMISFEDNGATLYPQPLVVYDGDLPDATYPDGSPLEKYRQLNEKELALFSITDEMVEQGWGWKLPLPELYYLKDEQIKQLDNRVSVFNVLLFELAEKYPDRITYVNIAQEVKKIADTGKYDSWGIPVSDKTYYAEGVPLEGGLNMNSIFSLDGVHFNQRGNAFLANLILEEINRSFQAKIPLTNVNGYIGNIYSN